MSDQSADSALPEEPAPGQSDAPDAGDAGDVADPAVGPAGEELDERRYPSTIGGALYLAVLGVGALGVGIVWAGDWRLGVRLLAGALCAAACFRLMLPQRDAGMLAVRNRWLDTVLLAGVGVALFFLVATIPEQPGA